MQVEDCKGESKMHRALGLIGLSRKGSEASWTAELYLGPASAEFKHRCSAAGSGVSLECQPGLWWGCVELLHRVPCLEWLSSLVGVTL